MPPAIHKMITVSAVAFGFSVAPHKAFGAAPASAANVADAEAPRNPRRETIASNDRFSSEFIRFVLSKSTEIPVASRLPIADPPAREPTCAALRQILSPSPA